MKGMVSWIGCPTKLLAAQCIERYGYAFFVSFSLCCLGAMCLSFLAHLAHQLMASSQSFNRLQVRSDLSQNRRGAMHFYIYGEAVRVAMDCLLCPYVCDGYLTSNVEPVSRDKLITFRRRIIGRSKTDSSPFCFLLLKEG